MDVILYLRDSGQSRITAYLTGKILEQIHLDSKPLEK